MERQTLLDTADFSDAILTGRTGVEDVSQGEDGLRITYDFNDGIPQITVNGIDGEVVFCGISEVRQAARAVAAGARMAERDHQVQKSLGK